MYINFYICRIASVLCFCLAGFSSYAQAVNTDKTILSLLPPLDSILVWAKQNAPSIQTQERNIEALKQIEFSEKREWQKILSITGGYFFGSSIGATDPATGNSILPTNGIRVGLQVNVPILYELSGRRNRIGISTIRVLEEQSRLLAIRQEFDRRVIEEYYQLALQQDLFRTLSGRLAIAKASAEGAAIEYQTGLIGIDRLSAANQEYFQTENDFLVSKYTVQSNFKRLEVLTGVSFSEYMK